ncbi:MAG: pyridoxal-phosphate dependent enzyme, partial [Gemmatimonadota bacterium]|nr:pyridoxal-phosphate dependent enzyme [Gemmatimonadota bacterium]
IQQLGAEIIKVTTGDRTLRAAIDEAIRAWVADPESTYYIIGSAVGPHPYPLLVRRLQSIIGREAREQMLSLAGKLPDVAIACVGGGSNAIGLFHSFLADNEVKLLGIEAGGSGDRTGEHAATMRRGSPGVLHGSLSFLLHDDGGQIQDTHSISAGLDYPGIGPEHAFLSSVGRVVYDVATDREALDAFKECASFEGILPALESAHALAGAKKYASLKPDTTILVGLSGRGDKDLGILLDLEGGNSND